LNFNRENSSLETHIREAAVCVIDHDVLMRTRLKELFESVGLKVLLFDSPAAFLQSDMGACSCVVLDVRLPEMSGVKLQEELSKREIQVPMVFVSGSGDTATAVRAMKAGAVDFLTQPVADHEVLDAVFAALDSDRERRRKEASLAALKNDFTSLSNRERQVLLGVAGGKLNKQVAAELGVSEVMVKVHRSNGMRKMQVRSMAELVRAMDRLALGEPGRIPIRDSNSAVARQKRKAAPRAHAQTKRSHVEVAPTESLSVGEAEKDAGDGLRRASD
jgi:FixJ family two-component response regulator